MHYELRTRKHRRNRWAWTWISRKYLKSICMVRDLCSLTFQTTLFQSQLIDEICWNKSASNNFQSAFRLMWFVHRLLVFCYFRQLIARYFYRSTEIIYDYTKEIRKKTLHALSDVVVILQHSSMKSFRFNFISNKSAW